MQKTINGYPAYQITNTGIIINKHGRVLKPRVTRDGYIRVMLTNYKDPKQFLVHRLVAEHFIPNPKGKPCVNHKDGKKNNNHYKNLEWVTRSENTQHASKNGLAVRGEKNGRSKLNWNKVRRIRKLYPSLSCSELATIYKVNRSTITRIINGDGWKER